MRLEFSTMHGAGNDFVVIGTPRGELRLEAEQVRQLAHRHFGVGCDQLLVVSPGPAGEADISMEIFNADGGEAEQCGNGVRCAAVFARDAGLVEADDVRILVAGALIRTQIQGDGQVTADMGVPVFDPARVPFLAAAASPAYALTVGGESLAVGVVSMGNPHAVLRVPDAGQAPVAALGPAIQTSKRFPQGVNVGFVETVGRTHIRLRVFERGVGETLACGSGACAAAVIGRLQGHLEDMVEVDLPGGRLTVSWSGEGEPVWMSGPTARVFEGNIEL
ncbi:MAG: diaminopimelate epimerase [Gammaproteobacteria bacterium]|nr:MAG: diaminopimelate epimerase [Gammaproteobacteria bacterium]